MGYGDVRTAARSLTWFGMVAMLSYVMAGCAGTAHSGSRPGHLPTTDRGMRSHGVPREVSVRANSATTTTTTTTTTVPPFSLDGSVPPPPLLDTGTDHAEIFRSLIGYRAWLIRHDPDPGLLDEAYVAGTEAFTDMTRTLRLLATGHRRLVEIGQWFEVETVSADRGVVTLKVREHIEAQRLIGPDGAVQQEEPRGPVNDYVVLLAADHRGRWRIAAVTRSVANAEVHL